MIKLREGLSPEDAFRLIVLEAFRGDADVKQDLAAPFSINADMSSLGRVINAEFDFHVRKIGSRQIEINSSQPDDITKIAEVLTMANIHAPKQ